MLSLVALAGRATTGEIAPTDGGGRPRMARREAAWEKVLCRLRHFKRN